MKADNQIYEWRETMKPKALSNINGMESQSDVSPWQGGKKEGSTPYQSRKTKPPEYQGTPNQDWNQDMLSQSHLGSWVLGEAYNRARRMLSYTTYIITKL